MATLAMALNRRLRPVSKSIFVSFSSELVNQTRFYNVSRYTPPEEAKRKDESDEEYREEIEDEEKFLAGEIEDDVQGERDQESDSRFAELFIGTSGIRRSGFS
jgi:hypothetical protein